MTLDTQHRQREPLAVWTRQTPSDPDSRPGNEGAQGQIRESPMAPNYNSKIVKLETDSGTGAPQITKCTAPSIRLPFQHNVNAKMMLS